jgi:acyl dehydratase
MDTAREKRYFEDLAIGEQRQSSVLIVDRAHMLDFARRYDPQYFHADPDAARQSVFGEIIGSGIYTMALWRQLDHEIAGDIVWICGIAWKDTRWPVALRAGDGIRAEAICVSKRRSGSDPRRGIVEMQYRLRNQRDEIVFETLSVNLVETRPIDSQKA